ncbi:UNKNOWN [Stylonychia lemnae]|uniref:Uncharacterized protein n=1 Tax=Stylonychia lemnae TaxID=5949 RepID=A0A078AMB6_STYLE|nr:UNKNOWN [Stylonychia lemnae]|eukprot:CDW83046.1 UNKNOWN [Stylonychia lemnae]
MFRLRGRTTSHRRTAQTSCLSTLTLTIWTLAYFRSVSRETQELFLFKWNNQKVLEDSLSYVELQDYKEKNNKVLIGKTSDIYDNYQLLHFITIAHSFTTIMISGFIYKMMRTERFMDRRQYIFLALMTSIITFLYYFSLLYMVWRGAQTAKDSSVLSIFEQIANIIGSISTNDVAFIFAITMNFVLLFGLYCINGVSVLLSDIARNLEQRRTGGRRQNELELNRLVGK